MRSQLDWSRRLQTRIKTTAEIDAMREGGQILGTVLSYLTKLATVGMTPRQLSRAAGLELARLGGEPVTVEDFPDIMCISVNEQVQHAIPTDKPLQDGDVVNFDFWSRYRGMVTDAGVSIGIGTISPDSTRLLEGTKAALHAGIAEVRAGARIGDISSAVGDRIKQARLGVVRDLMGHAIGHELHEEPGIPNYGRAGRGPVLAAGMTICIEPIATLGSSGRIFVEDDDWTLVSADDSWSAQWEHTVLVTEHGSEILTLPQK
jgi:methionyl aminopeptidase